MDYERRPYWPDDMENAQWLELLHPFTAVKNLRLGNELVQRAAPALRELTGEMVTEVLPALQNIILHEPGPSGPVQDIIGQFVDARHVAGCYMPSEAKGDHFRR